MADEVDQIYLVLQASNLALITFGDIQTQENKNSLRKMQRFFFKAISDSEAVELLDTMKRMS